MQKDPIYWLAFELTSVTLARELPGGFYKVIFLTNAPILKFAYPNGFFAFKTGSKTQYRKTKFIDCLP